MHLTRTFSNKQWALYQQLNSHYCDPGSSSSYVLVRFFPTAQHDFCRGALQGPGWTTLRTTIKMRPLFFRSMFLFIVNRKVWRPVSVLANQHLQAKSRRVDTKFENHLNQNRKSVQFKPGLNWTDFLFWFRWVSNFVSDRLCVWLLCLKLNWFSVLIQVVFEFCVYSSTFGLKMVRKTRNRSSHFTVNNK